MSLKMDRQGARTPADLERKYGKYGKTIHETERQVNQKVPQTDFEAFVMRVDNELPNKLGKDEVWIAEYDIDLQAAIMRSPASIYGRLIFKNEAGMTSQLMGNVFTVLAPTGIVYVAKALPDYSSATNGYKYFYEATFEPIIT